MDKLYFSGLFTFVGMILTYLFGSPSKLLGALVVFIVIDYVSGLIASAYEGELSSKVGFRGILKKVAILFVVAVAHSLDQIFAFHYIRDATIFFYIANELLSVIENVGRLNVPIPKALKKMIKLLHDQKDKE
ncbi:phage holin family protein [Fictibacillus sp. Mic-4]|uniref:phage holin family protein n=1 Tax=Fictibacillus TaxID=1329200 RepID=UPI0004169E9D|nr:phage holin family protein [Fictibacillus gelatini]